MAEVFNYIRPGFELIKVNFTWNVQVPFLNTTNDNEEILESPFFYSQETPGHQWKLALFANKELFIQSVQYDSEGLPKVIIGPVLVKISILNKQGEKVHKQMLQSEPNSYYVLFNLSKKEILESECRQADGSYTFNCKILSHVKRDLESPSNPSGDAISYSEVLVTQFEECILR